MIGRILNWDFGEQLVRAGNEADGSKDGIPELWMDDGKVVFRDSNGALHSLDWKEGDEKINVRDILTIRPDGIISRNYAAQSGEVDIFVTNQCNSNCIMCPLSETVRRQEQRDYFSWLWKFIHILPNDLEYVNVTGGEPTLLRQHFFEIMEYLKNTFSYAGFQLLTNGRSLADKRFLKRLLECSPRNMRFAIPIHASKESVHDAITQSKGSFQQTNQGIHNLLNEGQKVEIRLVVSKKNINELKETAKYIVSEYKGIFCVNFIAMEMMGSAAVYREELWVNYPEVFQKAEKAVKIFIENGIDVQLYNFPLCAVKKGYWPLAVKSITDYKVRYMPECEFCKVKEICGGFFASTKQLMKPEVWPIGQDDES